MKYVKPLTKKPLFKVGGKFLDAASDPTSVQAIGMSMASAGADALSPQKTAPQGFGDMGFGSSLTKESNIEKGRAGLEKVASAFGPVGMAISAASAIGRGIDNASKDEFGVYRSKGAAVLDTVLDPIGTVTDLFTGELFGGQKERRQERDIFQNRQQFDQVAKSEELGAQLRNSIPAYQAPAYGKRGMKFKTSKFADGGKIEGPPFGRYRNFKESLPPNLANTSEREYAMRRYWRSNGRPQNFDEAMMLNMFTPEDDGEFHAPSIDARTMKFLKPVNHPTVGKELELYNAPGNEQFREDYKLVQRGRFYKYKQRR